MPIADDAVFSLIQLKWGKRPQLMRREMKSTAENVSQWKYA